MGDGQVLDGAVSPSLEPSSAAHDPIEAALGEALQRAALAGAWDTVSALTAELKARREARAKVVSLAAERLRREK